MLNILFPFQEESDLRKLSRNRPGEPGNSYDHSMIENNMDGDTGHQASRGRPRQMSSEDDDFVDNFRDHEAINTVDKYARFCFPISYLLFNICYWIIFLAT